MKKLFMNFPYFVILLGILNSCTHGPATENKSPLNYLNGENYQANTTLGPIPISVTRVVKNTKIRGQCFFKNPKENNLDDFKYPVKYKRIAIIKDGIKSKETATDSQGYFEFNAIFNNGEYIITISDKDYKGQLTINVESYQLDNIIFQVQKSEKN